MSIDWITVVASVLGALLGAISSHAYQLRLERLRMKAAIYADAIDASYTADTELGSYLTWLEDEFLTNWRFPGVVAEGDRRFEGIAMAVAGLDSARARIRLLGPQEIFDVVQVLLFEYQQLPNATRLRTQGGEAIREHIDRWRDGMARRAGLRDQFVRLATREVLGRRAKPVVLPDLSAAGLDVRGAL